MHEEHLPTDHGWVEALTSYEQGWVFGWRRAYYGAASGLAPRTNQTTPSAKCELAASFQATPGAAKSEEKKEEKDKAPARQRLTGFNALIQKSCSLGARLGGRQSKDGHLPKRDGTASRSRGRLGGLKRAGQTRLPLGRQRPSDKGGTEITKRRRQWVGACCFPMISERDKVILLVAAAFSPLFISFLFLFVLDWANVFRADASHTPEQVSICAERARLNG